MQGVLILITLATAFVLVSLLDDDSSVSLVTKYLIEELGIGPNTSSYDVLRTVERYERWGFHEKAIATGVSWVEKHPREGFMDAILLRELSLLYLESAKKDEAHREDFVRQAMLYRDKALSSDPDSPANLDGLAGISLRAGDMSSEERCLQYGNTVKLLEWEKHLYEQMRAEALKESHPNPTAEQCATCVDATERRLEWVQAKRQQASCVSAPAN